MENRRNSAILNRRPITGGNVGAKGPSGWTKKPALRQQEEELLQQKREKRARLQQQLAELDEQALMLEHKYEKHRSDYDKYQLILKTSSFQNLSQKGWSLEMEDQGPWFIAMVEKFNREVSAQKDNENENQRDEGKQGEKEKEKEKKDDKKTSLAKTLPQQYSVVAMLGYYDKGKTWLINKLIGANFPSSKKHATQGISFCMATGPSNTNWMLLDTAGFGSPIAGNYFPRAQTYYFCSANLILIYHLS